VVHVTIYLESMDDFDGFDVVYRRLMPEPRPARATVGVSIAPFRVEISAVAVLPGPA
jgi:2-iminobutanoate/2-iminopropanoate deaminase